MTPRWFSIGQITEILQRAESGTPVADLLAEYGISQRTYNQWEKLYGSKEATVRKLKDENRLLKRLVTKLLTDEEI